MNKLLKISTALVLFLVLCVISLSSLIYIYEKREDLYSFFQEECNEDYETCLNDEYWAKEILNGGYILHFRHAEREKWIDVQMYDSLESDVHSNGELGLESNIRNGKIDGLVRRWYENGQLEYEAKHKEGEEDGLVRYWHKNGQLKYSKNIV